MRFLGLLFLFVAGCSARGLGFDEPPAAHADGGFTVIATDLATPADLAISCAQAKADFETVVMPIIRADCLSCHSQGSGVFGGPDLFTYLLENGYIGLTPDTSLLLHAHAPSYEGFISPTDRATLGNWILELAQACGI